MEDEIVKVFVAASRTTDEVEALHGLITIIESYRTLVSHGPAADGQRTVTRILIKDLVTTYMERFGAGHLNFTGSPS